MPDRIIEKHLKENPDEVDYESEADDEGHDKKSHRMACQWRKRHRRELKKMNYDEIMVWFEQMEFRDSMGHQLENNVDFQNLAMMADKWR